jgi:hypothetical protein
MRQLITLMVALPTLADEFLICGRTLSQALAAERAL